MKTIARGALVRLKPAAFLLGLLVAASGCFEVEQTFRLERDLSGKAEVRVAGSFEPFIRARVYRAWSSEGKAGEPPVSEIDGAVAEVSKALDALSDPGFLELMKAEARKRLPAGIEFLDYSLRREEKRAEVRLAFAFDHASKVSLIRLQPRSGEGDAPGAPAKETSTSPFAGFRFEDEGATFRISLMPEDAVKPFSGVTEEVAGKEASTARKEETAPLRLDRLTVRIDAPFEVVETNATKRQGTLLLWDYDAETIAKTPPEVQANGIWVRFKK